MERDILQRRVVEVEDAACLLTWDFSLKIPKAEEATDESGHTHIKYIVEAKIKDSKWTFETRYSAIDVFHNEAVNTYHQLTLPPLPPKTLTARHDPQFVEERRVALAQWLSRALSIPSLRQDSDLLSFLNASLNVGAMKYRLDFVVKQKSLVNLDIFCLDVSKSMKKSADDEGGWFFGNKTSRFQKATSIMFDKLERAKNDSQRNFSSVIAFCQKPLVIAAPQPTAQSHIELIKQNLACIQYASGTAIYRACDMCNAIALEFASQFFQTVVVSIHLFTDAEDNLSNEEEKLQHTELTATLKGKEKLKDIYFTVIYNHGENESFMQNFQKQLPGSTVLNAKSSDIQTQIHQYEEQRRKQVEEGIRKEKLIFGIDLELIMQQQFLERPDINIPELLRTTFDSVLSTHYTREGLFRVNTSIQNLVHVKQRIDHHENIDWRLEDPDLVAAVIKKFFDELPDCLLTATRYPDFIGILNYPQDQQLEKLKELVFNLPEHNKNVLIALLEVVSKIIKHSDVNKMTSQNLATCLAPVLMKHSDISVALMSVHKANSIIEFMFRNCDAFLQQKPSNIVHIDSRRRGGESMIIPAPWTGKQEEMYVKLEKQQGLHAAHAPAQQQQPAANADSNQSKIAQEVLLKARSKTISDTRTSQKMPTTNVNNNQAPANFNKPLPPVPPRRAVSPPPPENNVQLPPVPARKKQPAPELLDLPPYQRRQLHPQIERQLVLQLAAQLPKTPEEH
jgi:hypothetical protein